MAQRNKSQTGAAAIFIVVFFAILITIIALSFLNIAMQDQQQATNNDLAQSAYDSADAGLEDATRALRWYRVNCPYNNPPITGQKDNCDAYNDEFAAADRCNMAKLPPSTLPGTQRVGTTSEVKISTNEATDKNLDQAYTCVTITTRTQNYQGVAKNGKSDTLIPLRTVNNGEIDTVELKWFLNRGQDSVTPDYPDPTELPKPDNWSSTAPPIMRFQLIPVLRGDISITDVDADTKTAFLYPDKTLSAEEINLKNADIGRSIEKVSAPNRAKCEATVEKDKFACSARIINLPVASRASAANTDYYLRLTALYNDADYQVRLFGGGGTDLRLFDNVEPEVDSTGRANDVFRRVQSRVRDSIGSNPLNDGGFDITKGVCKEFTRAGLQFRLPGRTGPAD